MSKSIKINKNDKRVINGETGTNNIQPFKYPYAWQFFLNANKNHWSPEEISMNDDIKSYKTLKGGWKDTFDLTMSYLSTADMQAMRNVAVGILDKSTSPEHTMYMARQVYEEALHCYAEGTEILTTAGWMDISKVTMLHDVLQYDKGVVKKASPLGITRDPYCGDMIHFLRDGKVVEVVTPNHNVLAVHKGTGKEVLIKARDFNNAHDLPERLNKVVEELEKISKRDQEYAYVNKDEIGKIISSTINLSNEEVLKELYLDVFRGGFDKTKVYNLLKENVYIIDDYETVTSAKYVENENSPDFELLTNHHIIHLAFLYTGATIGEVTDDTVVYHVPFKGKVDRSFIIDALVNYQVDDPNDDILGWVYDKDTDELQVTTSKVIFFATYDFAIPENTEYQAALMDYYISLSDNENIISVRKEGILKHIELLCVSHGYTIVNRTEVDDTWIDLEIVKTQYHPVSRTVERVPGYDGTVYSVGVDSRVIITKYNDEISICGNTWTYNVIVDSIGLDPDVIYNNYLVVEPIRDKINYSAEMLRALLDPDFDLTTTKGKHDYVLAYIFFAAVFEGTWFYNGFTPVFALARADKMRRTGEQFQYILRDEILHATFGIRTALEILKENPDVVVTQQEINELFNKSLEFEITYAKIVVSEPILDYTQDTYIAMSKYISNRRAQQLGFAPVFPEVTENAAPWVDKLVNSSKEKNFFETRVTEYQTGAIDDSDAPDEDF